MEKICSFFCWAMSAFCYKLFIRDFTLSVGFLAHFKNTVSLSDIHQIFGARNLWPWLGPALAVLRYVIHFRFYE